VDKRGNYSKSRESITAPVTRVPQGTVQAPRQADAPQPRPHESSSGVVFVNKATGSIIAGLFVLVLVGVAYMGSTFFTREHQFEHYKNQQHQMKRDIEHLKSKNLQYERRMVELETQVENMQDAND
jgi:hypothetical protein